MAASVLDGEKLCEVSGNVRWSSMAQAPMSIQSGSLAVYKLSDSFYIHARTTAKRGKVRRCISAISQRISVLPQLKRTNSFTRILLSLTRTIGVQ